MASRMDLEGAISDAKNLANKRLADVFDTLKQDILGDPPDSSKAKMPRDAFLRDYFRRDGFSNLRKGVEEAHAEFVAAFADRDINKDRKHVVYHRNKAIAELKQLADCFAAS